LRHAPDDEAYRHYIDSGEFTGNVVDMWQDIGDSKEHTKYFDAHNDVESKFEVLPYQVYRKI
jgi:hypothetical protein